MKETHCVSLNNTADFRDVRCCCALLLCVPAVLLCIPVSRSCYVFLRWVPAARYECSEPTSPVFAGAESQDSTQFPPPLSPRPFQKIRETHCRSLNNSRLPRSAFLLCFCCALLRCVPAARYEWSNPRVLLLQGAKKVRTRPSFPLSPRYWTK